MDPQIERRRVLEALRGQGGYTAGQLAKLGGWTSRADMGRFRSSILKEMLSDGLLEPMDDQKPMIFVSTSAGRALLAEEGRS